MSKGKKRRKPTLKQRLTAQLTIENGGNVSKAMRDAGYSPAVAHNPHKLTGSETWQELMDIYLPEDKLTEIHNRLLDAKSLDHMVFPLLATDAQIRELLTEAGCTVRRLMHGVTATHVWFWAPNNGAQHSALELAYKLRGKLVTKVAPTDPDGNGLFAGDGLTIKIVDGRDNPQP